MECEQRLKELEQVKMTVEKRLNNAPKGSLTIARKPNFLQFYLRESPKDKNRRYVHKSETALLRALLQKRYDEPVLKALIAECKALQRFCRAGTKIQKNFRNIYYSLPDSVRVLIDPIDIDDEDYARLWLELPYEGKPISDDLPSYRTDHNELVRSKSELIIANRLLHRQIPYKYECPMLLKSNHIIYPDFTILNKRTRKTYLLEHFGMVDDRNYANNMALRIRDFERSGLIPGKNLLFTIETASVPLRLESIDILIDNYFI